jgi:hypothetical protein
MEVSGKLPAPAALPPGMTPGDPLFCWWGGPNNLGGRGGGGGGESLLLSKIEPRSSTPKSCHYTN